MSGVIDNLLSNYLFDYYREYFLFHKKQKILIIKPSLNKNLKKLVTKKEGLAIAFLIGIIKIYLLIINKSRKEGITDISHAISEYDTQKD